MSIVVQQTAEAAEAVSAHTRAMLVDHPIEIASSGQHTVWPWLSARLNFVPPVVDRRRRVTPKDLRRLADLVTPLAGQ